MSRTVEARLILNIEDAQLPPHIKNVQTARDEWEALGKSFDKIVGGEFKNLSAAMVGLAGPLKQITDATKASSGFGRFVTSITDLASPLLTVSNRMGPFADAAAKAAPHIEKLATETTKWSRSIQTLSQVLNTLTNRMESLATAQQKADQNLANFGLGLSAANKLMKEQGQDMLRVLQAYAGFNKATQQATKGVQAKNKESKGLLETLKYLERAYIRHSTVIFIAQHQMESMIDSLKDAATQTDLNVVLGRSLVNFQQTLEDTRKSTNGMVTDLKIMQSAALMSSFGIPMEDFAANMQVVQKLAIRTGQSTDFLMESFARGVSRLSPAILDNLGLQISLKEAYDAYAASVGKATSELDAQEKKTAVLNQVLRQGNELTSEVDPAATLSARLEQARTTVSNFFANVKMEILDFLVRISASQAELTGITSSYMKVWVKELNELRYVTKQTKEETEEYINSMSKGAQLLVWYFGRSLVGAEQFDTTYRKLLASFDNPSIVMTSKEMALLGQVFDQFTYSLNNVPALDKMARDWSRDMANSTDSITADVRMLEFEYGALRDMLVSGAVGATKMSEALEAAAKGTKAEAALLFQDAPAQAAYIGKIAKGYQEIQEALAKAQKNVQSLPAFLEMIPFIESAMKIKIQASTAANAAASKAANAAQLERLALLDREVVQMQHLVGEGKGITNIEIDLLNLRKESAKALSEYQKLMEQIGNNEGETNEAAVFAAGEHLKALLAKQQALETSVKLQKDFGDALSNTAGLSKGLVADLAQQIAGGKTRNQLEKEFLDLRTLLAKATTDLAVAQFNFGIALAQTDLAKMAKTALDLTQAAIAMEAAKNGLIANAANRDRLPRASGGGGNGDKDKETKDTTSYYEEERVRMESYIDETGLTVRSWTNLWEKSYDSVKGWSKELLLESSKDIERFAKAETGAISNFWFGMGEGQTIASMEKAIELNEEQLQKLSDFEQGVGGLTPVQQQYKVSLIETNWELERQIKLTNDLAGAFHGLASGITNAFAGGEGILGGDFLNIMNAMADSSERMGEALKSEAAGYGLVSGAMPMVRAFSKELIDSKRKQATIEMLMNTAAAFAAIPNWPQVAAHSTAALIYGMVSGGVLKLPTKSSKTDKDSAEREVKASSPINVYLYGTEFITSEGQMGQKIEDGIQQARAEGRI